MPIYSFAKSRAGFFVQSRGKARNPGRTPTGQNPTYISVVASCLGFWKFTETAYDLTSWFSQCTVSETAHQSASVRFSRSFLYQTPLYKHPQENLPAPIEISNDPRWSTFFIPNQYDRTIASVTPDSITMEFRFVGTNSIFLTLTATVGGEEREFTTPRQDIDDLLPDLLDFPDISLPNRLYQVISGLNLFGPTDTGAIPLRRVQAAVLIGRDSSANFSFPFINPLYLPKANITFYKSKARYKTSNPATDYLTEDKDLGGSFIPSVILNQSALPLGIDVAEPPNWAPDPLEFLGLPLPFSITQARSIYRSRRIVPPDTL